MMGNITPRRGSKGMPLHQAAARRSADVVDDVVRLDANESAWGCSPAARAAFMAAAGQLARYPDGAYVSLRQALARRHGIDDVSRIAVGAGSEHLIMLLVSAFAGEGDDVVLSETGFLLLRVAARLAGASIRLAADRRNLQPSVDNIVGAATADTAMVLVATPNNPTGRALSATEIEQLRQRLPEGTLLLLDLAYAEYADADMVTQAHALALGRGDTVVVRTFSKAYGLAGARVGWALGAPELLATYERLRAPFPITRASVEAALAALDDKTWLDQAVDRARRHRASLSSALEQLGVVVLPSATNFVLASFESPELARRVHGHCEQRGIHLRDVSVYGLADSLRITAGTTEEHARLIDAMAEVMLSSSGAT